MEKHIADKDIDNGRMYGDFKSSSSRAGIDMRKDGIFEWNLAVKELKFLVVRRSLVRLPDERMCRLVMLFISIGSETVCPCHFCCFHGSLMMLFGIRFGAVVNTELTTNGNDFGSIWTSLRDLESIKRYMLSQKTWFGALSIRSFGH